MKKIVFATILSVISFCTANAQLTPFHHWTLLPASKMDAIIGEASGETALHHVIEMAGYYRNRPASEYAGNFHEGQYVLDMLNEYGISSAQIERFDERETWDGIKGELWEVSPFKTKLADYDDIAFMLARGSKTADVYAELAWVEEGKEEDFEGLDVKGKIVVTSSHMLAVYSLAGEKGAAGVISFGGNPLNAPMAVSQGGIWDENATFGFNLPPREGIWLRNRLIRGEKIKVHAVVESEILKFDIQVPTCVIPGTEQDADEIIFSAHIFEGYVKQGANDNLSGSAVILEVARMLNTMFEDGRLKRPKRSIRFIWVPEFSGTIPWVNAHKDIMDKTLCNINLDMVGLHLKSNNSFLCMMRTSFGNPHYINDVMENYFTFVGKTNRKIFLDWQGDNLTRRIVAPSGSDDPFYYKIETHKGASDHDVFNDWNIKVPGILMITWPDFNYHNSEDLPDKLDATQLKRSAAIVAAAAYTIASADEKMAISIAGEVFSNSPKRMGHQLARAMDELNNVQADNFPTISKKVMGYLEATFKNEQATILSVAELAPESKEVNSYLSSLSKSLGEIYKANLDVLEQHIKITANNLNVTHVFFALTDLEKKAQEIVPKTTQKVKESIWGDGGRGLRALPKDIREMYPIENIASTFGLKKLINGKNSVLDIKKMLDTQYEHESGLQDILNYMELLKRLEMIEM